MRFLLTVSEMRSYDFSMRILKLRRVVPAGLLALGLAFTHATSPAARAQTPSQSEEEAEVQSLPGYAIGPADVLSINVWKEPDLTGEFAVRFDGMITCPLIGDVQAAGLRPMELAGDIQERLQRYIETPMVSVGVSEATSARFFVLGQVTRSGEFPLSGRTTVLQGLALAGGFKDFAKKDRIVIIREDESLVRVDYDRIADGKDAEQNVVLRRGDTIVVP